MSYCTRTLAGRIQNHGQKVVFFPFENNFTPLVKTIPVHCKKLRSLKKRQKENVRARTRITKLPLKIQVK
jgi:hypothetical protein